MGPTGHISSGSARLGRRTIDGWFDAVHRAAHRRDASRAAEHDEREHEHDELSEDERRDEARVHRHRLEVDVGDDVGRGEQHGEDLCGRNATEGVPFKRRLYVAA